MSKTNEVKEDLDEALDKIQKNINSISDWADNIKDKLDKVIDLEENVRKNVEKRKEDNAKG